MPDEIPSCFSVKEEWVRLPRDGEKVCGLGRRVLSDLCQNKSIRSVRFCRGEGERGGVRLIHLPSLHAYLNSLAEKQAKGEAGGETLPL